LCWFTGKKTIFLQLSLIVSLHITKILIAFLVICLVLAFHVIGKTIFRENEGSYLFQAVMQDKNASSLHSDLPDLKNQYYTQGFRERRELGDLCPAEYHFLTSL
jgi:hypothetical protein